MEALTEPHSYHLEAPLLSLEDEGLLANVEEVVAHTPGIWGSRHLLLALGAAAQSAAYACCSLAGVFLPQTFRKLGASTLVIGLTLSAYPASFALSSLILSYLADGSSVRRQRQLVAGWALEALVTALSGQIPQSQWLGSGVEMADTRTQWLKIGLFIGCQLVQGAAGASSVNALCALTCEAFAEGPATALGVLESCAGLAYMLGPMLGGVLFHVGGFRLPYLTIAALLLLLLIPLRLCLAARRSSTASGSGTGPGGIRGEDGPSGSGEGAVDEEGCEAHPSFERQMEVVLLVSLSFIGSGAFGLMSPGISEHIQEWLHLEGKVDLVGAVYAIPAAVYAVAAVGVGWVMDTAKLSTTAREQNSLPTNLETADRPAKKDKQEQRTTALVLAGAALLGLSMMSVGPAPFWACDREWVRWTLQTASLAGIGMGFSMVVVPIITRLNTLLSYLGPKGADLASIWTNGSYSLGEAAGPFVGGVLTQKFGFQWTGFAGGCTFGMWLVLYIVFLLYKSYRYL